MEIVIDGVNLEVVPDERGWLMEILRCDDDIYQQFGQDAMGYSMLDGHWSDAGTFESLLGAGVMVKKKSGCEGFT